MPRFLIAIALTVTLWTAPLAAAEKPRAVTGTKGMVVAVSPEAADVGTTILRRGGTAVDAAVAVALAMAVTHPQAGNIGGGGFMMIAPPGGDVVCVDYRERAPAAATKTMLAEADDRFGHHIVGVPGTVRGLALAHKKYGKLPWKTLVEPAVELAEEGFLVHSSLAKSLNSVLESEQTQRFPEFLRVFGPPDGQKWEEGDRLVQPDLAATLSRIAAHGPDEFYTGRTAQLLAAEMRRGEGGLIAMQDLADYRAKVRKPIHTTYSGYDVYGPPPPSSGGICLALMLNTLENFDLKSKGRWSPDTVHLMIESMRRAYLDRARHLGDQDFVDIPEHLTSKKYAARLAKQIDMDRATPSESLAPDIPLAGEGESTTHFSVIDANGLAVSNTYTLEFSWGSRVVVRGGGFLLNNEMGDFNWIPGHTDREGRIGTEANLVEPGKRMLSSQTPTIVTKDGKPFLLTGSPGGRTIINTVLCVVLNVIEFDMDLPEAIGQPRLHHQWLPDVARIERHDFEGAEALIEELKHRGHTIRKKPRTQGDAHSILIDPETGVRTGVADTRRHGRASVQ